MIAHNRPIAVLLLIDMFALLMYNVAGMHVTGQLGAVFRTVLETMRTLFVWLVRSHYFLWSFGYPTAWLQAAGCMRAPFPLPRCARHTRSMEPFDLAAGVCEHTWRAFRSLYRWACCCSTRRWEWGSWASHGPSTR